MVSALGFEALVQVTLERGDASTVTAFEAAVAGLSQVRHATCTSPVCRRPAAQCDVEHNAPYEAGGRTCLCNTGPKCKR